MSLTKVLVTGGAGFIGSNLCEYLLAHDYDVICLDNFPQVNLKTFSISTTISE